MGLRLILAGQVYQIRVMLRGIAPRFLVLSTSPDLLDTSMRRRWLRRGPHRETAEVPEEESLVQGGLERLYTVSPDGPSDLRRLAARGLLSAVALAMFFGLVDIALLFAGCKRPAEPRILLRTTRPIDGATDLPYMRPDPVPLWSPRPGFDDLFRSNEQPGLPSGKGGWRTTKSRE